MKNSKVVFLHGLDAKQVDLVLAGQPAGFEVEAIHDSATEEHKARAVSDAEFVMIYRANPSDELLRCCKKVRLIQLLAAGYDNLNIRLIHDLKIRICNNGGANSWAVADHTVLLILALYRRLVQTDAEVRSGAWNAGIDGCNTFELAGKTVGILGMGNIGRKVARRVQAFDAQVKYHQPRRLPDDVEQALNITYCPLDELARESDVLSLHAPLTEGTKGIISRQLIESMKPSAIVVNTSRGGLIDENALIDALSQRRLAGAGLDAFSKEPIEPGNPLLSMPQVILTPHYAGTTSDTWRRRGLFAFSNFEKIEAGLSPEAEIVNK